MVYVSVRGGTHAGWKTQKLQGEAWTCVNGHDNPRYMVRCRECREVREA